MLCSVVAKRVDVGDEQQSAIETLCEQARVTAQCVEFGSWLIRYNCFVVVEDLVEKRHLRFCSHKLLDDVELDAHRLALLAEQNAEKRAAQGKKKHIENAYCEQSSLLNVLSARY
jgi:hypothetical protein